MRSPKPVPFLLTLLSLLASLPLLAAPPKVVATLLPVHSVMADLMREVAEPGLLLPGSTSPHSFSLRPSTARRLQEADLVVWIGEEMERFLAGRLQTLAPRAESIALLTVPGQAMIELDDHPAGEADHDPHGSTDPHLWLNPRNVIVWIPHLEAALTRLDPDNAARYAANARRLEAELQALDRDLAQRLTPLAIKPFVVFHDAYRHLVERYSLTQVGALRLDPSRLPQPGEITRLRQRLQQDAVRCIFHEPQFDPKAARVLAADYPVQLASIDPLGVDLPPGPGQYRRMMDRLARSLEQCLSTTS